MATTLPAITNAQYLEGLYGLGVDYLTLRDISASGTQTSFKDRLRQAGITDDQLTRAQRLVTWRPNPKDTPQGDLNALVDLLGGDYAARVVDRANQLSPQTAGSDPTARERAIREIVPPTAYANMLIKTGRTSEVAPEQWNPFRGDKPASTSMAAAGAPPLGVVTQAVKAGVAPVPRPPGRGTAGSGDGGGGGYAPAATPPPVPLTPAALRAQIEASYGWAAALADEPEVAAILNDYAANTISLDEAERRFRGTGFYQRTTEGERNWKILERTDPAEAAKSRSAQFDNLKGIAEKAGVVIDEKRLAHLTDLTLRYGWTDTQVARYMAAEFKYDPTGQRAGITQTLKNMVRDYLVPLSDATLTLWGQAIISGTKTEADFDLYLRAQAKSMFPGMAGALDDPNLTTRDYLDPYAQITATTLGINADDINWTDPKWMRAVNQVDDKGIRSVMSVADWQRTLISDPTFGYDQTANGKAAKADLGRGLLQTLGFTASTMGR